MHPHGEKLSLFFFFWCVFLLKMRVMENMQQSQRSELSTDASVWMTLYLLLVGKRVATFFLFNMFACVFGEQSSRQT